MSAQPNIPQEYANAIVDPKSHEKREVIDEIFTWFRKEAPLAQVTPEGHDPIWVVTKHADIKTIQKNNKVFHNGGAKSATIMDKQTEMGVRAMTGRPNLVMTILEMDGQNHFSHRALTQHAFMPKGLKGLDEKIEKLAEKTAEHFASLGGECDFVEDVALNYPLRVIMELLGVPPEDEPLMLKLTQEAFGAKDPELNGGVEDVSPEEFVALLEQVFKQFGDYFNKIMSDRRKNPREDIASVIANGEVHGEPLGEAEAFAYFFVVAAAGHDTTSNSISSAMWQLAKDPDLLRQLKENEDLIGNFIDEAVRWETPVRSFMRNAVEDIEISGQQIKKGDWLMMCYPSANRDEDVFDAPFTFDITREKNPHLSFGFGPHQCLGQHLARAEMKRLWEKIIPRLESVELAGEPRRTRANFVNGPKTLPIKYKMS